MSWDKTRAEYLRKARSMPTGQTHVSVLAKDLEYLCEQAQSGELAHAMLAKRMGELEALHAGIEHLGARWQALAKADPESDYAQALRDCARELDARLKGKP